MTLLEDTALKYPKSAFMESNNKLRKEISYEKEKPYRSTSGVWFASRRL